MLQEPTSQTGTDHLIALGLRYIAFARDNPPMFAVMFDTTERHPQSPEGKAALAPLAEALAALDARNRLRLPPDDALRVTWAFVHGIAQLQAGGMLSFQGLGDDALRALMRPVLSGGITG
ncbi:WHG domain-containing protein [Paracoccus aurantiacus]|uniref:WHG domain-containing protein n=1 Tax=Paracoccus aurantiacus TaxID=2599412 RepID=A0A5C6S5Y9_9RHOB|nr:TetR-like C-terminal domain-containing protein [Paracoccus aurantiacus]TXB69034.1 WHG domain-containing protein [Paracoccus aurantiacus]